MISVIGVGLSIFFFYYFYTALHSATETSIQTSPVENLNYFRGPIVQPGTGFIGPTSPHP